MMKRIEARRMHKNVSCQDKRFVVFSFCEGGLESSKLSNLQCYSVSLFNLRFATQSPRCFRVCFVYRSSFHLQKNKIYLCEVSISVRAAFYTSELRRWKRRFHISSTKRSQETWWAPWIGWKRPCERLLWRIYFRFVLTQILLFSSQFLTDS